MYIFYVFYLIIFSSLEIQINSWQSLQLDERLVEVLQQLGYKEPLPLQINSINSILSKKDTLICTPTGYGKTISFVIPVIQLLIKNQQSKVLIIEPTTDLVNQTNKLIQQINNKLKEQNIIFDQKTEILIMTPTQFISYSKLKLNWQQDLLLVVIDECDLLFAFKQEHILQEVLQNVSNIQKVLVSATLSSQIQNYSKIMLKEDKNIIQLENQQNQQIKYIQCDCQSQKEIFEYLYIFYFLQYFNTKTAIYTQSNNQAFKIHFFLKQLGIQSAIWSNVIDQTQRDRQLNIFNKNNVKHIILQCQDSELIRGIDLNDCQNLLLIQCEKIDNIELQHVIGRCCRGNNIQQTKQIWILGTIECLKDVQQQKITYDQQTFQNSFSYRFNEVFKKSVNDKTINNYKFQLVKSWQGKKGQIAQGYLSSSKDNYRLPSYLLDDKTKVIQSIKIQ